MAKKWMEVLIPAKRRQRRRQRQILDIIADRNNFLWRRRPLKQRLGIALIYAMLFGGLVLIAAMISKSFDDNRMAHEHPTEQKK